MSATGMNFPLVAEDQIEADHVSAGHITVHIRYFAAARSAAGIDGELISLPPNSSVLHVVTSLRTLHGHYLSQVLNAASFLLDGVAVRDRSILVGQDAVLDVLPPFAGG